MRHDMPESPARGALHRRAFTLLELLVTIGVIALLLTLIIVAFRGARQSANRAESSNALRQIMVAYNAYSADAEQMLMPGFISASAQSTLGITTKVDDSIIDGEDAESFVWRLAPYLSEGDWRPYFIDYRHRRLAERIASEIGDEIYGPGSAGATDIGAARVPSFGLNSIYMGGDDVNGSAAFRDRAPWGPDAASRLAATRLSEVKNAARVVVFGPTEYWDNGMPFDPPPFTDIRFGAPELRAPRVAGEAQWEILAGTLECSDAGGTFGAYSGWLVARWSQDELPVSHLDGSVTTENIVQLAEDDRFWSPFATGY